MTKKRDLYRIHHPDAIKKLELKVSDFILWAIIKLLRVQVYITRSIWEWEKEWFSHYELAHFGTIPSAWKQIFMLSSHTRGNCAKRECCTSPLCISIRLKGIGFVEVEAISAHMPSKRCATFHLDELPINTSIWVLGKWPTSLENCLMWLENLEM